MSHDSMSDGNTQLTTHNYHPTVLNGTGNVTYPTPMNGAPHNPSSVNGAPHYPAPMDGAARTSSNSADDASFPLPSLHPTPSANVGYGTESQSRTTTNPNQASIDSPCTPSSSLVSPLTPLTPSSSSAPSPLGTRQNADDSSVSLSNVSSHWKTIDTGDEDDLFDDEYFKQNMPGLYTARKSEKLNDSSTSLCSGRGSAKMMESTTSSHPTHPGSKLCTSGITAKSTSHSPMPKHSAYPSSSSSSSRTNTSVFRYENISNFVTATDASPGVNSTHGASSQRYENISESGVGVTSQSGGCRLNNRASAATATSGTNAHNRHNVQPSAFSNVQHEETTTSSNQVLKSLSQRVDEYFSHQSSSLGSKHSSVSSNSSQSSVFTPLHRKSSLTPRDHYNLPSSPGYNETNTGIEPYSRAIFSFRAQYPNELTFKKGDIVHLVKHIDSHWTLGKVGDNMGIFPTSYVDVIVDCLHDQEEVFLARSEVKKQAEVDMGLYTPRRDPSLSLTFSEPSQQRASAASFNRPHRANTVSYLPQRHTTITPQLSTPASVYLGHAKALYEFQGVQAGDVCMTRGDILKIIRHIDANWAIVKNLSSGFEGMCPKNYMQLIAEDFKESLQDSQTKEISKDVHNKEGLKNDYGKVFKDFHAKDIQIEEESKVFHTKEGFKRSHSRQSSKGSIISDSPPWEAPTQLVDLGTSSNHVVSERKPRLLVQSTVHERSRSSSPFGSSGKRRSYNKEDFGSIRKQDVEPILAKNMASLDATIKVNTPTGADKKTIESVFAERELESIKSNISTGSEKTSSRSVFLEREREVSNIVSTSLLHIDQAAKPRRPVSDPLLHLSVENASSEDANFTGSSTPIALQPSQLKPEHTAHVQKPKIQAPKPGIAAKPELHPSLKPEAEIMKPEIVSPKPEVAQTKPGISALKLERPVAAPRTTTNKPSIPPRMRLTKRASCSSLTPSSSDSKSSASSMSAAGSVLSGGGGGSLPASPPIAHSRGTSLLAGTPISLSQLNSPQNSQLSNTQVMQENTTQSSQLSSQVSLLDESEGTLLADTTDILTPVAAISTSTPPGSAAVPPVLTSVQHILMPTPAASTLVPTVTTTVSHPPSESVYACIRKPSQSQPDRNNKQPPSLPRGDSVGSAASFPEDVSHVSSDGPYVSG